MSEETIQNLVGAGIGVLSLFVAGGMIWAIVLLLRRAPNAQIDAFSFANGVLKTNTELSAELREDGKRREAAAIAHIAALNATTEVLRTIADAQKKDAGMLINVHTAVTTQADLRHREVMGAFDVQAGFYPAIIEELRAVKRIYRNRKRGNIAPIRGALERIEKQLKRINDEHITNHPPTPNYRALPIDWRRYIHAEYGAVAHTVSNGNGNGATGHGWNTNDA